MRKPQILAVVVAAFAAAFCASALADTTAFGNITTNTTMYTAAQADAAFLKDADMGDLAFVDKVDYATQVTNTPSALKNPASLTAGSVVYDGSEAKTITAATLGAKTVQSAVSDPTASNSTSTTFIDTISQDTNGVITATKKKLPSYKPTQTAVNDPTASGNSLTFIATASQATDGKITVTKKTVQNASATQAGVMSSAMYTAHTNAVALAGTAVQPAAIANMVETTDFSSITALTNTNPDTLVKCIQQQAAIITKLNAILAALKGQ